MPPAVQEDDLLILALSKRLITLQDIRDLEDQLPSGRTLYSPSPQSGSRIHFLVALGKITSQDLQRLTNEILAARGLDIASVPTPESKAAPLRPPKRYKILNLLGQGGMGKVYKAHDLRLNRYVALKFIQAGDPDQERRFLQEAQVQARVEHAAICRVYEVGHLDGRPYIAMQFIDGRTLRTAMSEMTLEQKLQVMRTVGAAVHEAHRLGLIHRDLNPSNIMVERSGDGLWKPTIMDFGLAKEVASAGMTAAGTIAGTPYYMSPEQAAGDVQHLDRRTDVYSLGATLYELLSGHTPFEGENALEVLGQVLRDDPPSVKKRNPSVPADLDCIVMKCLERLPQHRYDSARALEQDLTHFLDGDPIVARPRSLIYRLGKRARKHRAWLAAAAAALLAVGVFGGMWVRERWTVQHRTALAQKFGQEIKEVESILRYAHMMPLHDISREKALVLERMKAIEAQMDRIERIGQGPGHYALGRGYAALDDRDQALEHLRASYESGYRDPELHYALGRALGEIYRKHLSEAEGIRNKEIREARKKEIERKYRAPALQHLKAGNAAGALSTDFAESLMFYYERKWAQALRQAEAAFRKVPWLYEAAALNGDIRTARGREFNESGQVETAEKDFDQAMEAYAAALAIAPSDPSLYDSLGTLLNARMRMEAQRGRSVDGLYAQALQAADKALTADPDHAESHNTLSFIYWNQANALYRRGEDPIPLLERAREAAQRAVRLKPGFAGAHNNLGLAYVLRADYEYGVGADPRPSYQQAVASYHRAVELDPGYVVALSNLGNAYLALAQYAFDRGGNPDEFLKQTVESYSSAARLSPEVSFIHSNLGNAYATRSLFTREKGQDPLPDLQLAIRSHQKAVELNPSYALGWLNLGADHVDEAVILARLGRDPRPSVALSLHNLSKALELNPSSFSAMNYAGNACAEQAKYELSHALDPEASLRKALSHLEKAIALNPRDATTYNNRGLAQSLWAKWAAWTARDPGPWMEKARTDFETALRIDPAYGDAELNLGGAYIELGRWEVSCGRSPDFSLRNADLHFRKGLDINPRSLFGQAGRAGCLLALPGQPPELQEVGRILDRALSVSAADPEVLFRKAELDVTLLRGARDAPTLDRARAALRPLVQLDPDQVELLALQAEVVWTALDLGLSATGEADAAVERIESALNSNPHLYALWFHLGNLRALQSVREPEPRRRAALAAQARTALDKTSRLHPAFGKIHCAPLLRRLPPFI
jgi:serine/threonine-protein kinase